MQTRITPHSINGGLDIKCRNFEICEAWFIIENLNCHSGELCLNCAAMYSDHSHYKTGILHFEDNIECPVCWEIKRCVKTKCNHYICIDDFKRMMHGEERTGEPPFPYPEEIEDEYYEDQNNPKWEKDYPLIEIYNKEHRKWNDEWDEKYDNEECLRKCPKCRFSLFGNEN
jgi:hypothetical protein